MRRPLLLALLVVTLPMLLRAQAEVFGPPRPPPCLHPRGFFALNFPGGWEYSFKPDGALVAGALHGDQGQLTITMREVPKGADTEMVALNSGKALKKLPHYVNRGGGRLTIAGKPASIRSFEFDYQGNTELTVAVEELYVVNGSMLYVIHFEAMKRSSHQFRNDLRQIYDSFNVAELDATGQPMRPALPRATRQKSGLDGVDSIPY